MSILQVSERIIKENFKTLEEQDKKTINHNESEIYYNKNILYKILKPTFRLGRFKIMHLVDEQKFPYANNIIHQLYQGDKFIGTASKYLENFETMKTYMNKIDLYEIKIIMSYLIEFYNKTLDNNLIYWDNHLNNIGISNDKFYIVDIDSMDLKKHDINVSFALNGLLTLFYEFYYKIPIRNEYANYEHIISLISECDNYSKYKLTLEEIKKIINDTSIDYLESKRKILENNIEIKKI